MSRWWRAYDEAVRDPKLILLTNRQHRAWFNLLCIASANAGRLPDVSLVAVELRLQRAKARLLLDELIALELFERDDQGFVIPHNWSRRQYKSDVSTPRVKRFRNAPRNVSETPPENRDRVQSTEKKKEPAPDGAARDFRGDLFGIGLKTLAEITGKTPDSCRSLVGRWLKAVDDEAIHVLGAIENAARNRVADPVAWITRGLQAHQRGFNGKRTVQDAARDQLARLRALDEPSPTGLRDGTGESPVRLLPAR